MRFDDAKAFWDRAAARKRFQHQLRTDWLRAHLTSIDILDCGCGYGRILRSLVDAGYLGTVGTDFSAGMLARCAVTNPELVPRLVQADSRSLPFQNQRFDAVVAFTLLTSMPGDSDQLALMGEIRRVLRPGGLVYISDLLLNDDTRNLERYQQCVKEFGAFGVFRLPEGVVVRHHSEEWIRTLTQGFNVLEHQRFTVTTMNGNSSTAFQYLGRLQNK